MFWMESHYFLVKLRLGFLLIVVHRECVCVSLSTECNGNLSVPQTFTADRTILWVHTFTHGLSHVSQNWSALQFCGGNWQWTWYIRLITAHSELWRVLFLASSVCGFFVCVWNISGTIECICTKFAWKTCLVLRSDEFEGQGQRSRSPLTKTGISRPFSTCVWFMFSKTSFVIFLCLLQLRVVYWVMLGRVSSQNLLNYTQWCFRLAHY